MENAEDVPGTKRRRIALACQACRTRKSRCDGRRPQCSACKDLDFDCVYVQSAASTNVIVGKEYLTELESRLERVEQRLDSIDDRSDTVPISPLRQGSSTVHVSRHARLESIPSSYDDVNGNGNEDSTDGMGAISFTDEQDSGFFGPSSNIAFTRHISRALTRISSCGQSGATPKTNESLPLDGGLMTVSRPPSPSRHTTLDGTAQKTSKPQPLNLFALPPEDETLDLVQKYFSNTGLLFPYLHKETFLETYGAMKRTNFTKVRKTWLGLLNMVLAFATSTNSSSSMNAEQRALISDVYYQRALGLCEQQIWRGTSVELVQYLLLMGQYLQGSQKSIQTWTIHGLAVKAAFQLGLHSRDASKRLSPLDREIHKRVWYGCVILDRTLSMTFGRPATIPNDYVKLELPVDFHSLVPPVSPADPLKCSSTLFYSATITLYKVMWETIELLYGANIGCESPISVFDVVTRVFKLEHQLMEWERYLSPIISLRKSKEVPLQGDENERYRIILTLRYHNLRILIHRLVVVRFLDTCGERDHDEQEFALLQQIGSNSVQICAQSSLEIISIVHTIVHSTGARRNWLGAWWFSLYYVFNAALVMSACVLINLRGDLTSPAVVLPDSLVISTRPVQAAVDALMLLDRGNRMVEKCAAFLSRLGHVLSSIASDPSAALPVQSQFLEDGSALLGPADWQMPIQGQVEAPDNTSPLGMDLGEFMIESDLSFLNFFAIN